MKISLKTSSDPECGVWVLKIFSMYSRLFWGIFFPVSPVYYITNTFYFLHDTFYFILHHCSDVDICVTYLNINSLAVTHFANNVRACFRHLLRAVSVHNATFEFLLACSYSKNFKFARCVGGFHLWTALNIACMPCLSIMPWL